MRHEPQIVVARSSIRIAVTVLVSVLALVVVIVLAATPTSYWGEQRMVPRTYRRAPLGAVIADLETHDVIPRGTTWADERLKTFPVTAAWIWPSDKEALSLIAKSARVKIAFQIGHHGEIWAPIRIERPTPAPGISVSGRQGPYRGVRHQPAN